MELQLCTWFDLEVRGCLNAWGWILKKSVSIVSSSMYVYTITYTISISM